MKDRFDPDAGRTGEFDMKPLKPMDEDGEYGRSGPATRVTDYLNA